MTSRASNYAYHWTCEYQVAQFDQFTASHAQQAAYQCAACVELHELKQTAQAAEAEVCLQKHAVFTVGAVDALYNFSFSGPQQGVVTTPGAVERQRCAPSTSSKDADSGSFLAQL